MHVFKIVIFMSERIIEKKWKNKNFMYKIMRIHVYDKESVDLFISKYNCASVE